MAYDEGLADRIRQLLDHDHDVTEKKMFGGLAFLVDGHMAVAVSHQGGILVRADSAKDLPAGAEPMIMRGRPVDGWARVPVEKLRTGAQLQRWVQRGVTYAGSLPPKR